MKTLFTVLIAFYSLAVIAQSDTIFVATPFVNDGDMLIFTKGDVYRYMVQEDNPWGEPVYRYLRIEDAADGWLKYTEAETVEGLEAQEEKVVKSRVFYKTYLRRNEWYAVQRSI